MHIITLMALSTGMRAGVAGNMREAEFNNSTLKDGKYVISVMQTNPSDETMFHRIWPWPYILPITRRSQLQACVAWWKAPDFKLSGTRRTDKTGGRNLTDEHGSSKEKEKN